MSLSVVDRWKDIIEVTVVEFQAMGEYDRVPDDDFFRSGDR